MLISSTYEREICRIVLPLLRTIVSVKLILRFHSLEKKTDMREEIWSLIFFIFSSVFIIVTFRVALMKTKHLSVIFTWVYIYIYMHCWKFSSWLAILLLNMILKRQEKVTVVLFLICLLSKYKAFVAGEKKKIDRIYFICIWDNIDQLIY